MNKADARREEIAAYVSERGEVRIDDLIAHFGVSRMTIHRHVDQLAQQGILRKLHGGVSAQPSSIYESMFRFRETVSLGEKEALAKAAAEHITPGQVVILDDSTTASATTPFLRKIRPLTVVTNSVASADNLLDVSEIDLICLGGEYHRTYNAYIGLLCENAINRLRVDVLICSASAIQETMAFVQDPMVVRVKQAMMSIAARKILLIDHTKFDKVALHVMAELTDFDVVISTDAIGSEQAGLLREAGVKLELVALA